MNASPTRRQFRGARSAGHRKIKAALLNPQGVLAPQGALVFKLEQTLCSPSTDYAALNNLIWKEEQSVGSSPKLLGPGERLAALKKSMAPKAYKQFRTRAESAAKEAETRSLDQAPLFPGVAAALGAARSAGWLVAVASDLGKSPVSKALGQKSLAEQVDLIAARSRLDQDRQLSKRLAPVKRKVKSLAKVVYFCNRSAEVKEAKSLGMRCIVLPSKTESFQTLLWAEPDGMILSLQELPQLLSLPSMKLPEQKPTGTANPEPGAGERAAPVEDIKQGDADSVRS